MVEWHHQLNRHESEQTLGDSEGQGSLQTCSSWGCKESDTTEQLNSIELEVLVGLHRTIQLLQRYWLGHRLGLL